MKGSWKRDLLLGSMLYLIGFICFVLFFDVSQFSGFFRNGSFNPKSIALLIAALVMVAGNLVFLRGARAYRGLFPAEEETHA